MLYDGIIFSGRAAKPVCLWINDENVEIKDASAYGGMDARQADKSICTEQGEG
jgi:aldehyde:ferredoxin oxidoreductase